MTVEKIAYVVLLSLPILMIASCVSEPRRSEHFAAAPQGVGSAKPNQFQHVALVTAPDLEFAAAIETIDPMTAHARLHYWSRDPVTGIIADTVINDVRCGTPPPPTAMGIGNDTVLFFPGHDPRNGRFGLDLGYALNGERLVGLAPGGVATTIQTADTDALPWMPGPWPQSAWFYIPLPLWPSVPAIADAITAHCGTP